MTSIGILGPGGVGAFLGAALARAGQEVVLVAREPTADAINRDGIEVDSARLGPFKAHPASATTLDHPADTLIVATKAKDLDTALGRVHAEPHLVVPLLNGLDHLHALRERFGPRAVAASIRIEAYRTDPSHVRQTSHFLPVALATANPRMRAAVDDFAATVNEAQIPARVMESEAQTMW